MRLESPAPRAVTCRGAATLVTEGSRKRTSEMTTTEHTAPAILPEEIARQLVLPESHSDLTALHKAYKWLRNNMPVAKAVVEGYEPIWLVSKHADIQGVESLSEVFGAGRGAPK